MALSIDYYYFCFSIYISSVAFEEYVAISGEDEVQIPSSYKGTLNNAGTMIKGKTVPADDDDEATFQLDLLDGRK